MDSESDRNCPEYERYSGIAIEVYIIEVYRKVHESIKYKTIHPNNISSTRLISKY